MKRYDVMIRTNVASLVHITALEAEHMAEAVAKALELAWPHTHGDGDMGSVELASIVVAHSDAPPDSALEMRIEAKNFADGYGHSRSQDKRLAAQGKPRPLPQSRCEQLVHAAIQTSVAPDGQWLVSPEEFFAKVLALLREFYLPA